MGSLIRVRWLMVVVAGLFVSSSCSKPQYSLPDQSQNFAQQVTYNNKVDIVLMIDNSSSMDIYQARLASEAPALIDTLNSLDMDYRIVVVTTDMQGGGNGGRFIGTPAVLTPATANLAALLQQKINVGTTGSSLERGLQSIQAALQYDNGATFIRQDAALAVLAITSEDDYSAGTAQSFINYFTQLKPNLPTNKKGWLVNVIGIPNLQSPCPSASFGYTETTVKWNALAQASGGLVESICQVSLAIAVTNIQKRIVQMLTDFPLNRKPILDTLVVRINGQVVPQDNANGWEYISEGYLIRFHGSYVPGATDGISVDFTPAEAN